MSHIAAATRRGARSLTGLLYVDPDADDLHGHLNTVDTPLNRLGDARAVPGRGGARGDQRRAGLTHR